ncbi:MAG: hypothetical protein HY662_00590 [Chloroflexi bacterium]|nr:hypothetical protein [Chloroflexota bacterium]
MVTAGTVSFAEDDAKLGGNVVDGEESEGFVTDGGIGEGLSGSPVTLSDCGAAAGAAVSTGNGRAQETMMTIIDSEMIAIIRPSIVFLIRLASITLQNSEDSKGKASPY